MNDLLFECYRIREIENYIASIYPDDLIQSPVHLSNGQEAISVGVCNSLQAADQVFGTYRGHALYLAKGGSVESLFTELFGRVSENGKGRAGSMHLSNKDVGMMGSSAIVASTISHAVGAALAMKHRNLDAVVVCFFGDGATSAGVYHESLLFASIYKLPVIFICENNGLIVNVNKKSVIPYDICKHAESYSIRSTRIENGFDPFEINAIVRDGVAQIRNDPRPLLFEIPAFRMMQHVGPKSDFGGNGETLRHSRFRKSDEYQEWKSKDPLFKYVPTDAQKNSVQREIGAAYEFARKAPYPSETDLLENVY
ncbi:thiamine pyrophosphate-dependent dehydrogenase E1 component subunit alpha [Nitrospinae bacterium]|nr:thiamine pyrophosphate-dependent dehydrogenase E1 component subunit alpha [Nitrospinota bacterium]